MTTEPTDTERFNDDGRARGVRGEMGQYDHSEDEFVAALTLIDGGRENSVQRIVFGVFRWNLFQQLGLKRFGTQSFYFHNAASINAQPARLIQSNIIHEVESSWTMWRVVENIGRSLAYLECQHNPAASGAHCQEFLGGCMDLRIITFGNCRQRLAFGMASGGYYSDVENVENADPRSVCHTQA